jgi:23S rRNA pseudouridine1911/1915/1917 synthase
LTRLDVALISKHPELSRRKAREIVEKGQVSVDGETVTEPGRMLGPGSEIAWNPHKKALPRARLSLPVLYSDPTLVIVDKPAGLLSVPSGPGAPAEDTALLRVQDYAKHLPGRGAGFVGVVHRLDRGTSGALAFALDAPTRQALRALFREHRIERRYTALVEGTPESEGGEVTLPIRDAYVGGKRGVALHGEASRPALTRWRVIERFRGAALLDVELGTGRQHQIRIHLAHVGHPVIGDEAYRPAGAKAPVNARRPLLHARLLGFLHPLTARSVRAESPLPEDFRRALATLRTAPSRPRSRGRAGRR